MVNDDGRPTHLEHFPRGRPPSEHVTRPSYPRHVLLSFPFYRCGNGHIESAEGLRFRREAGWEH